MIEPSNDHLSAFRTNDESALKSLYRENFYKVEQFVKKNSGTSEDAKDVYQEAFLSCWKNIREGKFEAKDKGTVEAYLFTIARNKWTDYLRSAKFRQERNAADFPLLTIETSAEDEEAVYLQKESALIAAFKELGANCKELLQQFYFRKLSLKTIAAHFGWTEATAKNNKFRCIQKLREMITENSSHE